MLLFFLEDYPGYRDPETNALSVDLGNSLNLEERESNGWTNDTSFSECDYLNKQEEEEGFSDEGEEWDNFEGGEYEEELTDLDTDDEDMPISEQDVDDKLDSCPTSKQPLRTCVQRELTDTHGHLLNRQNFLEVKGAGMAPSSVTHHTTTEAVDQEMDMSTSFELVAEVERRRLRDFGSYISHHDFKPDSLQERIFSHDKGRSSYGKHKVQSEKMSDSLQDKSSSDKDSDQNHDQLLSNVVASATGVRTRGAVSALSDDSVGVSTSPRDSDQPSPALTPSLFPGCLPPTIHFPMPYENCEC